MTTQHAKTLAMGWALAGLITFVAAIPPLEAQNPRLGILGKPAPELDVDTWLNLPSEIDSVSLEALRGKVVYLFLFQSWCPGCHSHGFPALVETYEHFADNQEVVFIAVQTTFEGYGTNTSARAEETVSSYGLPIPVGHDSDEEGDDVPLMRRYRSGGTPWTVIVDRAGIVRFNGFQIRGDDAIRQIARMLETPIKH